MLKKNTCQNDLIGDMLTDMRKKATKGETCRKMAWRGMPVLGEKKRKRGDKEKSRPGRLRVSTKRTKERREKPKITKWSTGKKSKNLTVERNDDGACNERAAQLEKIRKIAAGKAANYWHDGKLNNGEIHMAPAGQENRRKSLHDDEGRSPW